MVCISKKDIALIIQSHIPDIDVQGDLTASNKLKALKASVLNMRRFFPDSLIIVSGHGVLRPDVEDLADHLIWSDLAPLDINGLVIDQPAQYKYVLRAIELAILEYSPKYIFKCRGDGFLMNPYLFLKHIPSSGLNLTQQTRLDRPFIGDLFMLGHTKTIHDIWKNKFGVLDYKCGNSNTGLNYIATQGVRYSKYRDFLLSHCNIFDIDDLFYVDLRHGWKLIPDFESISHEEILEYVYKQDLKTLNKLLFGFSNKWHVFDIRQVRLILDNSPHYWYRKYRNRNYFIKVINCFRHLRMLLKEFNLKLRKHVLFCRMRSYLKRFFLKHISKLN